MPNNKGQNLFNFVVVLLATITISLLFYVKLFNPDFLSRKNLPEIVIDQDIIDKSIAAAVTVKGHKVLSDSNVSESCGSGFFISDDGLILTNEHVINNCSYIYVTDCTGKKFKAETISYDIRHDLAVLQINAEDTTYLDFEQNDNLYSGQPVAAIGNPLNTAADGKAVITLGRISRLDQKCINQPDFNNDRFYDNLIQVDAAILPGSSGGPLINQDGLVIGVNTATARTSDNAGIGFAITTNQDCREIIRILASGKTINHGFLGTIHSIDIPHEIINEYNLSDLSGAFVSSVLPGSPAQKAGIKKNDIIKTANDLTVNNRSDLIAYINQKPPGEIVNISLLRPQYNSLKRYKVLAKLENRTITNRNGYFEEMKLPASNAWGITVKPVTKWRKLKSHIPENIDGVIIYEINHDGQTQLADIHPGDIITHINNQPVRSLYEFSQAAEEAIFFPKITTWQSTIAPPDYLKNR